MMKAKKRAGKKKVSVKAAGVGAKVNERTSRRVAKIAGEVLARLKSDCGGKSIKSATAVSSKCSIHSGASYTICTVADLKALAASCLTQTYNKKESK